MVYAWQGRIVNIWFYHPLALFRPLVTYSLHINVNLWTLCLLPGRLQLSLDGTLKLPLLDHIVPKKGLLFFFFFFVCDYFHNYLTCYNCVVLWEYKPFFALSITWELMFTYTSLLNLCLILEYMQWKQWKIFFAGSWHNQGSKGAKGSGVVFVSFQLCWDKEME